MVVYISAGTRKYIHAVIDQSIQRYCISVRYTSDTSAWLQSLSLAPSQFFQMVTDSCKLTIIWCLHSGKFSVPDQRLTQSVASEAKTSFKSLTKLCSNSGRVSAAWANRLPSLQKLPQTAASGTFPPALTAQLLEGDGVWPVMRTAQSENIHQSFRNI